MTPHPCFPSPRTLSALHLSILKTLPSPHFPPSGLPPQVKDQHLWDMLHSIQNFPAKSISIRANLSSKSTCTQRSRVMPGSEDLGTCRCRNMRNVGGRNECVSWMVQHVPWWKCKDGFLLLFMVRQLGWEIASKCTQMTICQTLF